MPRPKLPPSPDSIWLMGYRAGLSDGRGASILRYDPRLPPPGAAPKRSRPVLKLTLLIAFGLTCFTGGWLVGSPTVHVTFKQSQEAPDDIPTRPLLDGARALGEVSATAQVEPRSSVGASVVVEPR